MSTATAELAARVNATLPHSSEQIGLLHFLISYLPDDERFRTAVNKYLADKASGRWPA